MKLDAWPTHLTYGMNVHPGETWAENVEAIRTGVVAVKEKVSPNKPFGLGLRLGRAAAESLDNAHALDAFRDLLKNLDLYVFTVNAFPYGVFHGAPVKTRVYHPDWGRIERLRYTEQVARILARLLPEDVTGSISTVPLAFAKPKVTPDREDAMIRNLSSLAVYCDRLRTQYGREVHVGLEPEPDCWIETTEQAIQFFTERLFPRGARRVSNEVGCSLCEAEALLRCHIGICFDTCHLAVQYEDVAQSLDRFVRAGIRLSKVQLSAALKTAPATSDPSGLHRFSDPVYLHQVKERGPDGSVCSRGDLASALEARRSGSVWPKHSEWRVHVHIPLHARPKDGLASTADDLDAAFFETVRKHNVEHLEIETYTFHVLPPVLQREGLAVSIAREYAWTLGRLNQTLNTE